MSPKRCAVCGENRFEDWPYCPACGHPYPDDEDDEDEEDEDEDDDDGALDD